MLVLSRESERSCSFIILGDNKTARRDFRSYVGV